MSAREMEERPRSVYWVLVFGLCSFSISPILVRFASEAPGLTIAVWRTTIAAVLLLPVALVRSRDELRELNRRDLLLISVAGVLLGIHFVTWIESLYHTTVASASVLVTTAPIFLAILGYVFLDERLSRRVTSAILLAVAGAVLIGLGDASGESARAPLLGNSLALTASLVFSIYLLVGRVVRQKTSWVAYVFPLYAVAGLTALIAAIALDTPLLGFSPSFYLLCLAMAVGPQLFGHGSFNYAIRYMPAAMLGLLSLIEPVAASILAFVLFDEVPGALAISGMVVVLCAIAFAIRARRRDRAAIPAVD
ncbi:MAG: DMT family transporter [Rhodothermales bacterium]